MRPRPSVDALGAHGEEPSWLRVHRFRFTLLALMVVAYLLVRQSLVHDVMFLPLWEFAAAIALTGFLLWSLRDHLKKTLLDSPIASPHQRHTTTVERLSETELDKWEEAFGEFFDHGDNTRLTGLVARLEREDGVDARRAFAGVLTHRPPHGTLLLHPLWGYLAATTTLLVLVFALIHFGGRLDAVIPNAASILPLSALAFGLWAMQFNRHGGPWWLKSLIAYAALAILPLLELATVGTTIPGPLTLMTTPLGIAVALVLLAQPLMHAWSARNPRPARTAYQGTDPRGAMEELIRTTERTLLLGTAWAAGAAVLVFLAIAEFARIAPEIAFLFPLYLSLALLLLIHPLVTAIGLRLDQRRVARAGERETSARRTRVQTALKRLEHDYARSGSRQHLDTQGDH